MNTNDACAEQRAAVEVRCAEAHAASGAHVHAVERTRTLRRDLVAAQHRVEAAEAASRPGARSAEKQQARREYESALQAAADDAARAEATAGWARAVDRANRSANLARRALTAARAELARLDAAVREAERAEQARHVLASTAEAACLEARVRLAACEERLVAAVRVAPVAVAPATLRPEPVEPPPDPPAAGAAAIATTAIRPPEQGGPLVIEALVGGERRAMELAASLIAEQTGLPQAEAHLQLQELIDAIVGTASSEGFLVFDQAHPFWRNLTFEEARDVVGALARLGFQFEPTEGWHNGRTPAPSDLSMALAYAGLDARNMRDLPGPEALRALPGSIGVDAQAFLASRAPDLTVDHLVGVLGHRSASLEPLWNEWGFIRPILLSARSTLDSPIER